MKKKGNPKRFKKRIIKRPRRTVTNQWGYIPESRRFCIICFILTGIKNKKKLTVHHDKPRSKGGKSNLKNLEILCEEHHKKLHHPYFYKKVHVVYVRYRKAKFNKIQTT